VCVCVCVCAEWSTSEQIDQLINPALICRSVCLFFYFCEKMQKWAYPADYLRTRLTNLDQLFSCDRHIVGDNLSHVRFEIAQGTLLW